MRDEAAARRALLRWYRRHARDLPFRRTKDPYRILVAEIVLQQTRVEQGLPFLRRFLRRFPNIHALASASEDDVLRAWEGLGYYRRARSLHQAARIIVDDHGGRIPSTYSELLKLPGIGPYTAGAVASIAFGEVVAAVDGNAARVLARLFEIADDPSSAAGQREFRKRATSLLISAHPGESNQSLMEIGALVCKPADPDCAVCPLEKYCKARIDQRVDEFPMKRKSAPLPEVEVAFGVVENGERVLAVRRIEGGLLAGLWGLPGGEVREAETPENALRRHLGAAGVKAGALEPFETRRKEFSSRVWHARIYRCCAKGTPPVGTQARWLAPQDREHLPFVPFHREILESVDRGTP